MPKPLQSEGLELISVGSLYAGGPWDKKYWSSSRGKERYPYPVGYHARRAHGGSNCQLEIRQGPQGPLFVITRADGESCSGQTPEIAWEKFQKIGAAPSKVWHGKRFSCKTDGIEFFGFKNPFVQRLLRELVANIDVVVESSTPNSTLCNEDLVVEQRAECLESSNQPDLLARPGVTRKRSKRHWSANLMTVTPDGFEVRLPGDTQNKSGESRVESKLPLELNEQNVMPVKIRSPGNSVGNSSLGHQTPPAPELATDASSQCCMGDSVHVAPASGKLVDKSQGTEMEGSCSKLFVEENVGHAPASIDYQSVKDIGLCVPDTLDFAEDSDPDPIDKDKCADVNETTRNGETVFGGLATDSYQDEPVGTSNSYSGSEKSDFESVGQDIAKSMMSFLLPQAVPLLKETSRKRRKLPSLFQKLGGSPKSVEETCERGQYTDYQPVEAYLHTIPDSEPIKSVIHDSFEDQYSDHVVNSHTRPSNREDNQDCCDDESGQCTASQSVKASDIIIPDSELVKSVIHDSFDDQCSDHVVNHCMPPSNREDTQHCCNNDSYPPCIKEDGDLNKADFSRERDGSKDIYCVDEEKPALVEQPPPVAVLAAKIQVEENDSNSSISNKAIGTKNASLRDEVTSEQSSEKDISTEDRAVKMENPTKVPKRVYTRRKVANATSTKKHNVPLSESIICRHSGEDNLQELTGTCPDSAAFLSRSSFGKTHDNNLVNLESGGPQKFSDGCNAKLNHLLDSATPFSVDKYSRNSAHLSLRDKGPKYQSEDREIAHKDSGHFSGPPLPKEPETQFCNTKPIGGADTAATSGVLLNRNVMLHNELNGYYELVGCYFHSVKVSSLLLRTDGTHIFICALCGVSNESFRTLFLYKLALEKARIGAPSFVGQTPITLPSCKDALGGIPHERCSLQLTPDGLSVAMLGSIRTPCCREQKTDCLCQICKSDGFDCASVKIVQVECGYVSTLIKLRTVDSLRCLLVCGPNHLAVAGESGGLHVWTMNVAWSAFIEEFCIPADYERCYTTVELKGIPKNAFLVVGHNGVGEFLVWDISRRTLLSRFSAPSTSISQISPIGMFSWSREVPGFSYLAVEDKVKQILDATRLQLSDHCDNGSFHALDREDPAIWLLVSTASVDDTQPVHISNDPQRYQWRLALLAKSMSIFGDELDTRAAAIGASACHGLMGTNDGLVYAWNLLSGSKLGTLHDFKGGSVSCIASESGVLAVADATGQLLVYQNSETCAY